MTNDVSYRKVSVVVSCGYSKPRRSNEAFQIEFLRIVSIFIGGKDTLLCTIISTHVVGIIIFHCKFNFHAFYQRIDNN
jgi:hypothetical protein